MTKTKKITLLAAIAVILALLIVAGVTGGANGTVDCPDCEGNGLVECPRCDAQGLNGDVDCGLCEGTNLVICDTCACGDCGGTGTLECEECYINGANTECENCAGNISYSCACEGELGTVRGTFWALIPPIIAIGLALITKEVYSSLFVGILTGALLYANFSFTGSVDAIIGGGLIEAVSGSAGIFIFLVELGVIVALINKAGGSAAFGKWAQANIKSRVGIMLATVLLGILIFVDDYFNCLTVGSVMRPATDSKRVSRAKLSYIIDATAAPICMIAPISSWAAAVATYAEDGQGLKLFISAIPYNFYSILTIVFVIAISIMGFDYGSMRLHEMNAINNGDLYTSGEKNESVEVEPSANGKVIDLILPVVLLIVSCVFGLLYAGGIMDGVGFVDAFANTDATVGLPWGGLISLVVIVIYLVCRRIITFNDSMKCVPQGFIAMVPAILILTFATGLKNITTLLGAKYFVGDLMSGQAAALGSLLPAVIFVVACVLAFATGTSWGTFGILIPIVTSIFESDPELLIIGMSACLAGAVCGDHCSPISDTTIMSSAGGQCNHLNHVSTQMPYAITVAAISFVMFVIAGFVKNIWICLPLGIVLTIGTLFVIKALTNKKSA